MKGKFKEIAEYERFTFNGQYYIKIADEGNIGLAINLSTGVTWTFIPTQSCRRITKRLDIRQYR